MRFEESNPFNYFIEKPLDLEGFLLNFLIINKFANIFFWGSLFIRGWCMAL